MYPSGLTLPFVVVIIIVLAANLYAISLMTKVANEKGFHRQSGTGGLWFIGFFASPIVLGLYVASLPDRKRPKDTGVASEAVDDELPSI